MDLFSKGGNVQHAPDHSRAALIDAYVAGANMLEITIQKTADGILVLCPEDNIYKLSGQDKNISELALSELYRYNFSATYRPFNSPDFSYYDRNIAGRRIEIELFENALKYLPRDLLLILRPGNSDISEIAKIVVSINKVSSCVFIIRDIPQLESLRQEIPLARFLIDYNIDSAEFDKLFAISSATGVLSPLNIIVDENNNLTAMGRKLKELMHSANCPLSAILYLNVQYGTFTKEQFDFLRNEHWISALGTTSLLQGDHYIRESYQLIDENFKGKKVDRRKFALGYAKANKYAHVFQDDGIHINILPFSENLDLPTDPIERKLKELENFTINTAKDWPYYSGGGLGVLESIDGDFDAQVEYSVERVCQASTLEMAIVNADPGSHVGEIPRTFRDKDSFYDPHGAPPFVGVEHDEDDGYRINWNFGSEYDNNGYGRPVGDGKNNYKGFLRLQRRGNYFSAYFKNNNDAKDWVCVGTVRNDSINKQVFLRVAAKRWRQEDPLNPTVYLPIVPNHFIFTNLKIRLYV